MKSCRPALPDMAAPACEPMTDRKLISMAPGALRQRRRPSQPLLISLLLVLVALLPHPAQAVKIAFDNCLPANYREHSPARLQWEPLHVDAVFDTENESHGLKVSVYGNVTGGEIVQVPNRNGGKSKATTLVQRVNVLTYEPYRELFDFCNDSLDESSRCPLGPVPNSTDL